MCIDRHLNQRSEARKSEQRAWQHTFQFDHGKPVVVEPSQARLTSDAGLLPIRAFDEQIGLTEQFAGALYDPRRACRMTHPFLEMLRQRVYGILADHEDQNDHYVLRSDPVAGRRPDDDDLASQPTLSRFENAISVPSLLRLQDVLVDQYIASFETPPARLDSAPNHSTDSKAE